MYIKYNFTANKSLEWVLRLISHTIENNSITDTSSAEPIVNTWHASIKANIDWETTEIFRSGNEADNVLCTVSTQVAGGSNNAYDTFGLINFRFPVYDDPTDYYWVTMGEEYYQYREASWKIGDNTSANAYRSVLESNFSPTQNYDYRGGVLTGGQKYGGANRSTSAYNSTSRSNIRSVIVYVTDTCLVWATTHGGSYPTGYGTTYNSSNNFSGPFIFSQYTRYDHWNSSTNGILPVAFTELTNTGLGLRTSHFSQVNLGEPTYTSGWRAFNYPDVQPKVGSSYPIRYFDRVHWGSGTLFNDVCNLQAPLAAATGSTAADYYDPAYGALVRFEDYYRYPSADLKDNGFAMHPIQIREGRYGFGGGNLSDQSGIYLFNGNYFPGDEFIYNNTTYAIVPLYDGYANRVGIAVPKV